MDDAPHKGTSPFSSAIHAGAKDETPSESRKTFNGGLRLDPLFISDLWITCG